MIHRIITLLVFMQLNVLLYSQSSIKGTVTDAENGETIIGCNIMLQGTTIGTVTNFDGNFEFKNVSPGTYNIIFSFISYDKFIQKIEVVKNTPLVLNVKLQASSQQLKDVVVTAQRRTDTEISMLSVTRQGLTIANGITSQQISRSQDKDASEVIRRIPGVSIREGKFVIVRGLTERYNSVWLNGSSTPSSESDVRAFSFDVIPSGQIDNILIYKTPAPELPADFAGAMINIKTKSLIDRNSITFSYSYGHHQGTTGKDFFTYQGGKTDWLGFDDGTRAIPSTVPTTKEFSDLFEQTNTDKINKINSISKSFNTILTPAKGKASPDADFQLGLNYRFSLGDISIGTVTAFGYNLTNSYLNAYRAAYGSITEFNNKIYYDTAYAYKQDVYETKVRLNALTNWVFTFGENQRIELRNIFNNNGVSKTVLKEGYDNSGPYNEKSIELGYESRFTYSSQLSGLHKFNSNKTSFDWNIGYSLANKDQPDIRRIKATADREPNSIYSIPLSPSKPDPNYTGRLFFHNEENILNGSINFSQKFSINSFSPELKLGLFYENKSRDFSSRLFGYALGSGSNYGFVVNTTSSSEAFDEEMFNSITKEFEQKLDYKTGMHMREQSNASDNYNASNKLFASYLALNLPITKWLNTYLGVRVERNRLVLNGFEFTGGNSDKPVKVDLDTLNIYPSLNTTISLSEKTMIRLAGGKTINRPEFREVSPFVFTSFEENVTVTGNTNLRNCYINSYDIRYEWYPTQEEIVSFGVFYKDFVNPIETKIIESSNWNYSFANAKNAKAYGLEFDVRKRLHEFEKSTTFKFLSNLTLLFNASLIKSSLKTDSIIDGESERSMQGQSPYLLNIGMYYQDLKFKFKTSLMYNKAGERISIVGKKDVPHIYEMPFNSVDFTIEKEIFKFVNIKFGVKNLLDDYVTFQQFQNYKIDNVTKSQIQVNHSYKPGRQIKLGVSVSL